MSHEVILLDDVDGLGVRGATVRVAPGYARNFLLPYGKALMKESVGPRMLAELERSRVQREAKERHDATALQQVLTGLSLSFERQVGEEEKLYGSVSTQDIHDALAERGYDIDRKKVLLSEPLKTVGEFDVRLRLFADITATIKVHVLPVAPVTAPTPEPAEA